MEVDRVKAKARTKAKATTTTTTPKATRASLVASMERGMDNNTARVVGRAMEVGPLAEVGQTSPRARATMENPMTARARKASGMARATQKGSPKARASTRMTTHAVFVGNQVIGVMNG